MMKPITELMEQDHDRLDGLFKEFQSAKIGDGAKATQAFSEFKRGLQRHIIWEEEFLFPRFEEQTGMSEEGPTAVMRLEHRRIKELLDGMHDRVAAGSVDTDEYEHELQDVLMVHNTKEEAVLYPAIDRCVSAQEAAELIAAMKALPAERYANCCTGTH
ncbi:MAG: hemerythrin domain-containing protein [Nitrospirota bacterium]